MELPRRNFLRLAAGAAALPALSRGARAQAYPARPVRIIVGFPAGGNADTIARPMGQWLAEHFGQPFVIENRPGAGSSIAAEAVVRAPPDGHTLLMASSANAINATLYDKLSYNFLHDLAPVAGVCHAPLVMVVHPSFPAKTVPEFIAYAKANPNKINMASVGNGTTPHVVGELFKMMTSLDLVHVPYRGGGSALTDLLGGQVQVFFPGVSGYIEHIRTGKLRALGGHGEDDGNRCVGRLGCECRRTVLEASAMTSSRYRNLLGIDEGFHAERTADIGRDQAEHVLRDLEHCLGERITHEMRTLRRRVEGRAAARRVEIGNGVARLHRVDNDTVVEEFECDNAHDPRECGVGAG
jgi:tripartite-type tricarboxylate transporter receptor subunit TctC